MYDAQSRAVPSGPRAGFWTRFAAYLIDIVLVVVAGSIVIELLRAIGDLLFLLGIIGYYTYMEGGPTGQTLGKRAVRIRVVDLHTGGPIGYQRAFVRLLGHIISGFFIDLGYFWMLWDGEKQTWHDKFAGAVVVPEADYPIA